MIHETISCNLVIDGPLEIRNCQVRFSCDLKVVLLHLNDVST
jgi:hypothetical protein